MLGRMGGEGAEGRKEGGVWCEAGWEGRGRREGRRKEGRREVPSNNHCRMKALRRHVNTIPGKVVHPVLRLPAPKSKRCPGKKNFTNPSKQNKITLQIGKSLLIKLTVNEIN